MKKVLKVISGGTSSHINTVSLGLLSPRVTMFPRYELQKYLQDQHSEEPALYILYNEVSFGEQSLYVGETEDIFKRLNQHNKNLGKNFWTHTIVMQDKSLNKAHFKYLEYMFYTYILKANRVYVVNSTVPTKSQLSEDDEILACEFIDTIKEIFTLLNIRFLEPKVIGNFEEDQDVYYLYYHGAMAKMRIKNQSDMMILAGSTGIYPVIQDNEDFKPLYKIINRMLKDKEAVMVPDTCLIEYKADIHFDSEHEACAFITQEQLDGSEMWKNAEGYSLYVKQISRGKL